LRAVLFPDLAARYIVGDSHRALLTLTESLTEEFHYSTHILEPAISTGTSLLLGYQV
jgi:hypothetical protein